MQNCNYLKTTKRACIYLLLIALIWACDSGNNVPETDGDESEIDSDDVSESEIDEMEICTANELRCAIDDEGKIEICRNDRTGWKIFRTCDSDQICQENICVEIVDGDSDNDEVEKEDSDSEETDVWDTDLEDDVLEEMEEVEEEKSENESDEGDYEDLYDECPGYPGMALIDDSFCIDRYEVSVMENSDCTGKIYGQYGNGDDFPEGFPDCVECLEDGLCKNSGDCPDETWGPQSAVLYACSIKDVIPSSSITWFQALKACNNSGKELCSYDEWHYSCSGDAETTYPYGDIFENDTCWTGVLLPGSSGIRDECRSQFGVYDQSGNLREWLADPLDPDWGYNLHQWVGGFFGYYSTESDQLTCHSLDQYWRAAYYAFDSVGFRCCVHLAK